MTRDDVFKAIDVADMDGLKKILDSDPNLAASKSNDGLSAVLFTLYIDKPDLADLLLSYKPALDLFDLSALGAAAQLSALLATEPKSIHEYSGDGFTALHVASYFGHAEVVTLLLDQGADVNKVAMNGSGLTALQSAVSRGNDDVVKTLLEFNADVDVKMLGGFTSLMMAGAMGAQGLVELLLENGADKTLVSDDGRDAASFASSAGHDNLAYLFSN